MKHLLTLIALLLVVGVQGGYTQKKNDTSNYNYKRAMEILDNDGNMILTEGLVLQEEKYWKEFLGRDIIPENNSCELYFEERDIEGFVERLEKYYPEVKYVNRLMTHSWGQKVIRFYDPDGNLIEVGTPM